MALSLPELGLSLAAGSLTTLSPCVFPMLPLVVGGAMQANRLAPVALGVGMAGSFALIGMALGAASPLLNIDGDQVRVAGALLMIAFAVVMLVPALNLRLGQLLAPVASSASSMSSRWSGQSLGGALLLGAVLGLVWSPCSGPLLGSALTLVASEGGVWRGGMVLGLFGLGAAMPLVAVAYASRSGLQRARGWLSRHGTAMKNGFALLLAVMGVAILSGADKWVEARVNGWLPDAWLKLTTGI